MTVRLCANEHKCGESCTRSIQTRQYKRTIIARSTAKRGQTPQLQPACCRNVGRYADDRGVVQSQCVSRLAGDKGPLQTNPPGGECRQSETSHPSSENSRPGIVSPSDAR